MTITIDYLKIKNLFGFRNYNIPFENNQMIFIGENGSGKSTIISILHYLLTCQWNKLLSYDFTDIKLSINQKEYAINKEQITNLNQAVKPRSRNERELINYITYSDISIDELQYYDNRNQLDKLRYKLPLPLQKRFSPISFRKTIQRILESQYQYFFESDHGNSDHKNQINEIEKCLSNLRVLYLPTFRRIESDLSSILPHFDEDYRRYTKDRLRLSKYERKHVELVEFGMEDVKMMLDDTMNTLATKFRSSLNYLTNSYLQVILRKEYLKTDISELQNIDDFNIDEILSKLDENTFSGEDKEKLKNIVIQSRDSQTETDIDLLSAHIVSKLILLHKAQHKREQKVRNFISVCNTYLQGKEFIFNSKTFDLSIFLKEAQEINKNDLRKNTKKNKIALDVLSSGEKQIVSLFSHLYLSGANDYFIIIDEPELSLSVPWQKTFLPDMLASEKCNGLVAVTHSPFIYTNNLEPLVHPIQDFEEN